MFQIETRKVQKTGGSSYIVSLPIAWIEKYDIKPKDSLGIIPQPDGNLLITPNPKLEEIVRTKEFIIDDVNEYNFLFRMLIGAYIMGYTRIIIKSSKKFQPFVRECVNMFTKTAIGPEIIEESNQNIIIKDLLNPKEMPFERTIRRMFILAESMHEDALNALRTKNIELAQDVKERDNEVDRLHWLVARQTHIVLRDIILSQKMGVTLEDANQFQFFSKFLERIGDHAVKIAKNIIKIINENITKELIENISQASQLSLQLLRNSLDAWLQKNIILANENIEKVKSLIKLCEAISINPKIYSVESSIAISYIIESIRRTGEYSTDISELIINNLVKQ